jgi:hypothetical protein
MTLASSEQRRCTLTFTTPPAVPLLLFPLRLIGDVRAGDEAQLAALEREVDVRGVDTAATGDLDRAGSKSPDRAVDEFG